MATFEILPAIDLRRGRVVRLRGGDFARETGYNDDPVGVARDWAAQGASWLHVVDLDGALGGGPAQADVVGSIVGAVGGDVRCELAGGLRTEEAATAALRGGFARAVIGTVALGDQPLVARLVARHGAARIAVALDVRDRQAVGEAWRPGAAGVPVAEAARVLADTGVTTFEVTSIERDGSLVGPDLRLLEQLLALDVGRIIASGGIATLADLLAVQDLGCGGAIVGRALYEGAFTVAEALAATDGNATRGDLP